jgi:hypothetical protein
VRAYGRPGTAVLLSAVNAGGPGLETHGVIVQDGTSVPGPRTNFTVRLLPCRRMHYYCAQREEPVVRQSRRCSRSGCAQPAAATLTYVYAESTAVVGPLATFSEPHSYDLCEFHAERLTVPRGWEVVRHEIDLDDAGPTGDDLLALADAVREAARPEPPRNPADDGSGTRRGHLRVLPDLT